MALSVQPRMARLVATRREAGKLANAVHSSRAQRSMPVGSEARTAAPLARTVIARAGTKITGEQLEVEIQDRDRPIIVDFYATWCGPCVLLSQELEKVSNKLGDEIKILKIDVDENPDLSSQLQIAGLPTMVFIPKESNRPALRTEGLLPAEQIIEIVKELQTPQAPAA